MTLTPRSYQIDAKRSVYKAFKRGSRSALVVAATGLGKGAIIGMIVGDAVRAGKRVLVFCHRREILDQLAGHVRAWSGLESAIEQGDRAEATDESSVVVASVQSLVRRFDRFGPDRFDLIIADEAHHCLSPTWLSVFDHFASAKIVGLTATPNRGDELALGQVFNEVAFEMPLDVAVREGWLVPLRTKRIELQSLDLSDIRRRHGDLVAGELGAVMSTVEVLREAVGPALDLAADKQTMVFCCTRSHMHAAAACVRLMATERRVDVPVATVDGDTPADERAQIFTNFKARKIRWLVGVDVFSEGVDVPGVEAVVCMRPTLSRVVWSQQRGRGARPLPGIVDGVSLDDMLVRVDEAMTAGRIDPNPDGWVMRAIAGLHAGDAAAARRLAIALSDKPECLVIDCTEISGKFDLADEMDALGGDYELPERAEAQRLLANGDARHLLDALEQARAARSGRMREAMARNGDPFSLFGLPFRRDRYGREPTPKHRRLLDPLRLPLGSVDWRQANDLCAEIARRQANDLCTYHQAHMLARLGYSVEALASLDLWDAIDMLEWSASNGWSRVDHRRVH